MSKLTPSRSFAGPPVASHVRPSGHNGRSDWRRLITRAHNGRPRGALAGRPGLRAADCAIIGSAAQIDRRIAVLLLRGKGSSGLRRQRFVSRRFRLFCSLCAPIRSRLDFGARGEAAPPDGRGSAQESVNRRSRSSDAETIRQPCGWRAAAPRQARWRGGPSRGWRRMR